MAGTSLKITNVDCPARCVYCYEKILRDKGWSKGFDIDGVIEQMKLEWGSESSGSTVPYLHGGEALSVGHEVIERLLRETYNVAGSTSIQTYGHLIDDRYIELFKKYKTHVGFSIDGPGKLNKLRVMPGFKTEEVTDIVLNNITKLIDEGISVSIICVLHKANASKENLPLLKEWLLWLQGIGIQGGRLNLMHTDYNGKEWELSDEEAAFAWTDLFKFTMIEQDNMRWQPFHDIIGSLMGLEQGTCTFTHCPYYAASAEPVIFSDGTTGNCLKTAKDGNVYPRLEQERGNHRGFGGIRYDVLCHVPQSLGGCQDCKYWRNCLGGCPSEGIDGDWRNKSRFCKAYYDLFEVAEKTLRNLIPNIILTTDFFVTFPYSNTVQGMSPHAFAKMDKSFVQCPSSWRGVSLHLGEFPVYNRESSVNNDKWISDIEHIDGNMRHLDSDLGRGI